MNEPWILVRDREGEVKIIAYTDLTPENAEVGTMLREGKLKEGASYEYELLGYPPPVF